MANRIDASFNATDTRATDPRGTMSHDTEAALLRTIATHPDDNTARLVYADLLEESGDPVRAEFVRLQIWLASNPEPDPLRMGELMGAPMLTCSACHGRHSGKCEYHERWERAAELLRLHEATWRGTPLNLSVQMGHWNVDGYNIWGGPDCDDPEDVRVWEMGCSWERGFVAAVTAHWETWRARGSDIAASHPLLARVNLLTWPEHFAQLEHGGENYRVTVVVGKRSYSTTTPADGNPPTPDALADALAQAVLPQRWPGIAFGLFRVPPDAADAPPEVV